MGLACHVSRFGGTFSRVRCSVRRQGAEAIAILMEDRLGHGPPRAEHHRPSVAHRECLGRLDDNSTKRLTRSHPKTDAP
jgi:hypothetical protein